MTGLTYNLLQHLSWSSRVQARGAGGTGGSEHADVNYCACY